MPLKHLPLREKQVKKQQQPDWMTYEIIQCMAQRDHFKSINDMVNYKTCRNRCVSLIRDAKTTYYKTCVEDHKGHSKKLWQYLRDIIPTNLKTAPPSLRNNSDNSSISDPEDMCEHFNNFFSTIVNQYIAVQQFSSNFDKLSEMVNSRINSDDAFSIPQLTEEEVCSYLRNLNTHKATGLDGLSHKILKMSTYLIAPSLTKIFNKSLSSGMFPTKWKTSKIIPIYKSGAQCDVNNYRPIAILFAVSKVLERHVHNHLYQFLVSHSLLGYIMPNLVFEEITRVKQRYANLWIRGHPTWRAAS